MVGEGPPRQNPGDYIAPPPPTSGDEAPETQIEQREETELTLALREETENALAHVKELFGSRNIPDTAPTIIQTEKGEVEAQYRPNTFDEFAKYINGTQQEGEEKKYLLPYHHEGHSKADVRRVQKMIQIINKRVSPDSQFYITKEMAALLEYAAATHDIVQKSFICKKDGQKEGENIRLYPPYPKEGITPPAPDHERNEIESPQVAINKLGELLDGRDDYKQIITAAHLHTINEKGFGPGTVWQKIGDEPWQANLIAFADVGGAAMEPEIFMWEGDEFLLEQFPFVLKAFAQYRQGTVDISQATKDAVIKQTLSWTKSQIAWAKGRKEVFNQKFRSMDGQEIQPDSSHVPPEIATILKQEVMNQNDESARLAEARYNKRENMTFEQLAQDFGFAQVA